MAPQVITDIIFLKLKFVPFIPSTKICVYKRISKIPIQGLESQVADWINDVMFNELSNMPSHLRRRYYEWRILSNNIDLFYINGIRYDKISVIFGDEFIHWVYYTNYPKHQRIQGWSNLPVSFCGCCLNKQYVQVMEAIKEFVIYHLQE